MKLDKLISYLIIILVITGGIYKITPTMNAWGVILAKNIIDVVLIVLIGIFYKKFDYKINKNIIVYSFILLLILKISHYFRNSNFNDINYHFASVALAGALYLYLTNINYTSLKNLIRDSAKYSKYVLIIIFLAYISGFIFKNADIINMFQLGFGGNRANFSMWVSFVSSIIVLDYILFGFHSKNSDIYVLFLAGIICNGTGGRLGYFLILLLLLIWLNATNISPLRKLFIVLLFIAITVVQIYGSKNYLNVQNNQSILRDGSVGTVMDKNIKSNLNLVAIDSVSSGRITHMKQSFLYIKESLGSFNKMLFGFGIENKKIIYLGEELNPHNLYLRSFLEDGLIGLIIIIIITIYPVLVAWREKTKYNILLLYLVVLIPSFFQPNTVILGINSMITFWIIYASIVSENYEKRI